MDQLYSALCYKARKGDANQFENCSQLKASGEKVAKQASVGQKKLEEAAKYDEANPHCTHLKSAIKPDGQVDQVGGEGHLDEADGPLVVELEDDKDDGATYNKSWTSVD